jgi:hypothetical protein
MTEISSAHSYHVAPTISRKEKCVLLAEFFAEHDLLASKTGPPGVITMTLSARFSPSGSHHVRLSSTIYNPHTIQNT